MAQAGKKWDKQGIHSGPGGASCPGGRVVATVSLYGAPLGIYKLPIFSASIQFHRRNQDMYEKVAQLCGVLLLLFVLFSICYENKGPGLPWWSSG